MAYETGETMSEGMHETPEVSPAEESAEETFAFVPMSFFGGRTVKEGDTEEIRVESVDPESGEVQVKCVTRGESYGGKKSMGDMFEEEMPEEA